MNLFAFLLAALFMFQAGAPALCMTNCVLGSAASQSCCLLEEEEESDCCMTGATCGFADESVACCAAQEMSGCTITESNGITEAPENQSTPCRECCVPCCTASLVAASCGGIHELKLSINPVDLAGPFPSNNGTPVSGYLDECFQPPEPIS